MNDTQTPVETLAESPDKMRGGFWPIAAVVVLTVVTFVSTLMLIWNADIFAHLACGQWMLDHGEVLRYDPFSVPETDDGTPRLWTNVHWLFQIIVTLLYRVGGFPLLGIMKASLGALVMLIYALALRRRVAPAWLVICGVILLLVMVNRVRVRPEVFTLVFLMLTVVLSDQVRRGASPKRLWWLVPVMLVWVNVHGLFFLGPVVFWSAIGGAWLDNRFRRDEQKSHLLTQHALAAAVAASAVCLISPWPLETVLLPLLLATRVTGQEAYYTYGVSELSPTWQSLGANWLPILVLVVTAAALVTNLRRAPLAHAVWLGLFALLAMMAVRNTALLAPVCGYLLAWHGWAFWQRIGKKWPGSVRAGPALAAVAILIAVALGASYVISLAPRLIDSSRRFGAGLQTERYPIGAAEFLRDLPADGAVACVNFGDAGAFLYYTWPKRLIWMDGRLEAHSLERFRSQNALGVALRTPQEAEYADLPAAVRFIFVNRRDHHRLRAMSLAYHKNMSSRFRLIYVGRDGALFSRTDSPFDKSTGDLPNGPDLSNFDRPLQPDGRIEGQHFLPWRWYAENPPPLRYEMGQMFWFLSEMTDEEKVAATLTGARSSAPDNAFRTQLGLLAIRYLYANAPAGMDPDPAAQARALGNAYEQRALRTYTPPSAAVPIEINFAAALHQLRSSPMKKLDHFTPMAAALDRIYALGRSGQIDAAAAVVGEIMQNLPGKMRVSPPPDLTNLETSMKAKLHQAQQAAFVNGLAALPLSDRAKKLASPQYGLVDQAIRELSAAPDLSPEGRLLLGDLYLRQGDVAKARETYKAVTLPENEAWKLTLREAMCQWVSGELFPAADALTALAGKTNNPTVRYYQAELLMQLGRYAEARAALDGVTGDAADLNALLEQLRRELKSFTG